MVNLTTSTFSTHSQTRQYRSLELTSLATDHLVFLQALHLLLNTIGSIRQVFLDFIQLSTEIWIGFWRLEAMLTCAMNRYFISDSILWQILYWIYKKICAFFKTSTYQPAAGTRVGSCCQNIRKCRHPRPFSQNRCSVVRRLGFPIASVSRGRKKGRCVLISIPIFHPLSCPSNQSKNMLSAHCYFVPTNLKPVMRIIW